MNRRKYYEILQPLAKEVNDFLHVFPRNKMLADIVRNIDDDEIIMKYLLLRYKSSLRAIITSERIKLIKRRDQHLDRLIDDCIKNSNIDLDKSNDV
jgi:replicative superfamily II helicase